MTATDSVPAPDSIRSGALVVLRRGGWIQGDYARTRTRKGGGKVGCCLVEALGRAAGLPPFALARRKPRHTDAAFLARWEVAHNLMDELAAALGRDPEHDELSTREWLTNWNDRTDRTWAEVEAALRPAPVETAVETS
ncbi:DUF6197 family protein [Nonomuraea wenchangensis]|uniref:Uncharacterized protein n=1 Tax=Nonomuraea wenchangensis TaxID=568860 RepID=A0A1I0LUL3_9ACTN|nr:hypothetical protein [Nonomuraea wenchangensis]SEU46399.1 hypothetical protein SAMN05421811_12723 [Nonomuraea wenchangensis]